MRKKFLAMMAALLCLCSFGYVYSGMQLNAMETKASLRTLDDFEYEFEYGGYTWISALLRDPETGEGIAISKDILDYKALSLCYPDRTGCTQEDYANDARADNPLYKYLMGTVIPNFESVLNHTTSAKEKNLFKLNPDAKPEIATKGEVEEIIKTNKDRVLLPVDNPMDRHSTTWWTQTNYGPSDFWFVGNDGEIAFHTGYWGFTNRGSAEVLGVRPIMKMKLPPKATSITYTNIPQAGASQSNSFEYSKNVNTGTIIGEISLINGTKPITYTLDSNGDDGYLNFEIVDLDEYGSSSADTLHIRIRDDAKDVHNTSLNAGSYTFCIQAVDANGSPEIANAESRVCPVVEVNQTTPEAAFDHADSTYKSIMDAKTPWIESVTAEANPDLKTTYEISGGNIQLIDIDSETGQITYKGGNSFGKVIIRATVDDAPETGLDNYQSAFVDKEIIIYREVDGILTPDVASSNADVPTFTTNDTNVKARGTIGTITGILGTPDTLTGTDTTYSYEIKKDGDYDFFEVDPASGIIITVVDLGVDTYTFTIVVSDQWSTKEIPVTVNVGIGASEDLKFYESPTSQTIITSKTVSLTDASISVFAEVKGSTNTNPVQYSIKDASTNIITVHPTTGLITIHSVGTVVIVAEKDGGTGQAKARAELTFTVTPGTQALKFSDRSGNELPKTNQKYDAYTKSYAPNTAFPLFTTGAAPGAVITYGLKNGSPADVIRVYASGIVSILNASLPAQMGCVIVTVTSHDPTGNYADMTLELPINIEKGTRSISFATDPIYVTSGTGSVTPVVMVDGTIDSDGNALIEVDAAEDNSIAWTSDNQSIQYEYHGETAKAIIIHATKPADRNYKIATAQGTLHILGASENVLTVTTPGKITYGDHFTIRSTQDDSASTNVQYTFTVSDTTMISSPTIQNNKAEFDALRCSGNTTVKITVNRTADGELPLSKEINVKVLPKEVTIQIDDQTKYRGEVNPPLTYQDFTDQLVSWNGVSDTISASDIQLQTTATTTATTTGVYPITGDEAAINQAYPNYVITFLDGSLTITEETVQNDWFHMELEDGSHTVYQGGWTNHAIILVSDHRDYTSLSLDQQAWTQNELKLTKEGETSQGFWMKKQSGSTTAEKKVTVQIDQTAPTLVGINAKDTNNTLQDFIHMLSGGIFFPPGTTFEITTSDKNGSLKVSGTSNIEYQLYRKEQGSYGTPIHSDRVSVKDEKAMIKVDQNSGSYRICMILEDKAGNRSEQESCHDIEVKKLDVDVDGDGKPDFNDPDGNGCADFNILYQEEDTGEWLTLNVDANRDGVPEMNIDTDGDGIPDINVDSDQDGKPDLNLVLFTKEMWRPTQCVNQHGEEYESMMTIKPEINIDLHISDPTNQGYHIPDINIDHKGDFKPHVNISTDGRKPVLNIVQLHEWNPGKDYKYSGFTYDSIGTGKNDPKPELNIDTDQDGRPDVNIDLNGDGKPELNIDMNGNGIPDIDVDTTGDGKPDANVDTNGDGKPDQNVIEITEWKPEKNVDGDIPYDTMGNLGRKDQLEDNGVVIEKPDGSFLPNFAIKVEDVTTSKKTDVESIAKDIIGEQEVKLVYDVSLLKDGIQVEPDGTLKVRVPIDSSIQRPILLRQRSDGTYERIEASIEEGYFVFETTELGIVSIIGDRDEIKEPINPDHPSVKDSYTSNQSGSMGGAYTGDDTHSSFYGILCVASLLMLMVHLKHHQGGKNIKG